MLLLYTPGPSTDTSTVAANTVDQLIVTSGLDGGCTVLASGFVSRHWTGFGPTSNCVKRGTVDCVVGTTTGSVVGAAVAAVVDDDELDEDDDEEDEEDEDDVDELESLVEVVDDDEEELLRASANANAPTAKPAMNTPTRMSISLRRLRLASSSPPPGPEPVGPGAVAGSICVGGPPTTGVSTVGSSPNSSSGGTFEGPVPMNGDAISRRAPPVRG